MKIESKQEVMSPAMQQLEELKKAKLAEQSGTALALAPNRIALIVDTSGSMAMPFGSAGSRTDAATQATRSIITASNSKDTHYAIITYNSYSHVVHPMGTGYAKLLATSFYPTGSTSLFDALQLALGQKANRCILLSDGEILDISQCLNLIEKAFIPNKIKIDTIAIGDANDSVMQHIADLTGGVFRRANTPEELSKLFLSLEPKNYLRLEHKNE